jgi:superfamily II DNA/RNA helicase
MPKSKKPAGGRAQNFEPRFSSTTSYQDRKRRPDAAASKPGSKSPKHRGFRAESDAAPEAAPKRRWTAQERAGRDESRAIRPSSARPARSGAPAERRTNDRPYEKSGNDRPARGERVSRDDRRPFGDGRPSYRDDRPARTERPARSYDDRPARTERPARSYDDRPARTERPARSYDDRPARTERPARSYDDRPARTERPARSYDDRPRRNDGPQRADWSNTPQRTAAHEQQVDVVHERLQADAVQAGEVDQITFGDLGLGQNIVTVLADLGAALPFPIQAATIPPILEGRDVLARGRTGSGKTIAFGGPLVENVLRSQAGKKREFGRRPRALILAPTRELALQIDRTIQPIARSVGLFTTQIYGGVPQARQVGALKKGVDIIIGTPGRIEDLIEQRKLDLSDVQVVVLDEADHMSELGFLEPVQRILRLVADGAQKLMFSATLDREVAAIVDEFLVDPAVYEVAGEDQESSMIDHRVLVIDHRDKAEILASLVDRDGKTLVFARTRAYAEMLAEQFDDAGISAVALHGDLNQAKRSRNLERLTSGRVRVLVATDVAARGIHVDDIDLVVQADPPDEYKTYLHRSGRTGRAGRSGTVVTLVTRQRRRRMTELLERAQIEAPFDDARAGDDVVAALGLNREVSAQ